MKVKKIYTKDLSVEEVIARLKRGEKVYVERSEGFYYMVDGVLVQNHDGMLWVNPMLNLSNEELHFQEEIFIDFKIGNYYKTTTGKKALCYHIDENAKENEPMFFFAPIGTENRSVIMLNEEGDSVGNGIGIECEWKEGEEKANEEWVDALVPVSRFVELMESAKRKGICLSKLSKEVLGSDNGYNNILHNKLGVKKSTVDKFEKAILNCSDGRFARKTERITKNRSIYEFEKLLEQAKEKGISMSDISIKCGYSQTMHVSQVLYHGRKTKKVGKFVYDKVKRALEELTNDKNCN